MTDENNEPKDYYEPQDKDHDKDCPQYELDTEECICDQLREQAKQYAQEIATEDVIERWREARDRKDTQ